MQKLLTDSLKLHKGGSSSKTHFKRTVLAYYRKFGRHTLPWRMTQDPYRILVSEVMLQQTQVDRVVPKYHIFLKQFPSFQKLSNATLGEVLRVWQGLGYNRRAKMLHACAEDVMRLYEGKLPKNQKALMQLPGIGPYTAGAVMTFAWNVPVPLIETNIRTVFIHHFYNEATDVTDEEILQLTEMYLDKKNPREWYWALMDYGSYLKKTVGNQNVRSKHYVQQSTFKGSDRQIRGAILRTLVLREESRLALHKKLPFDPTRIDAQLEKLSTEGMIIKKKRQYTLP